MPHRSESKGDLEQYQEMPEKILAIDKPIRFCGIVDKLGYLVSKRYRKDVVPLMSDEDNAKYALFSAIRRRPKLSWKEKTGKTLYIVMRNENLIQAKIPLSNNYLMLVYFDVKTWNYDTIIRKKILPLINAQNNNHVKNN